MPNADFFLTSLTQKVRLLTFSAKADQSGSTDFEPLIFLKFCIRINFMTKILEFWQKVENFVSNFDENDFQLSNLTRFSLIFSYVSWKYLFS